MNSHGTRVFPTCDGSERDGLCGDSQGCVGREQRSNCSSRASRKARQQRLFRCRMLGYTGAAAHVPDCRHHGVGNRKSEIGNRKSAIGNRRSGIGDRESEIGDRKSAIGNRRSGIGKLKSDVESRKEGCAREPSGRSGGALGVSGTAIAAAAPVSLGMQSASIDAEGKAAGIPAGCQQSGSRDWTGLR